MKVVAIYVMEIKSKSASGDAARIIISASDLSHVGWFQRGSVSQVMTFTAKTVAERTLPGQRHVIDDEDFSAYIYRPSHDQNLATVTVTDKEYPGRAAHCIGPQVMSEFLSSFKQIQWENAVIGTWPFLSEYLTRIQQPQQAMDKIAKIQLELDSTTEIMHKNIEQVLERGEKLDDLMAKTEELDMQTKMFVKSARKANRRCCSLQ